MKRLPWKKIMGSMLIKGRDFWSNGHFAFYTNKVTMPAHIPKLKGIDVREPGGAGFTVLPTLEGLIKEGARSPVERADLKHVGVVRRGCVVRGTDCFMTPGGIHFETEYIEMLDKIAPGFVLEAGARIAAVIKSNGVQIGVLMPVNF